MSHCPGVGKLLPVTRPVGKDSAGTLEEGWSTGPSSSEWEKEISCLIEYQRT